MKQMIVVPSSFNSRPFYERDEKINISSKIMTHESLWEQGYFIYDILKYLDEKSVTFPAPPWKNKKDLIELVLKVWQEEGEASLHAYFNERNNKKAKPLMLKYTAIYIQVMVWLSDCEVISLDNTGDELEKLSYAPINIKERIEFILKSPSHYHSFVTLTQLFNESKKKWAVYLKN